MTKVNDLDLSRSGADYESPAQFEERLRKRMSHYILFTIALLLAITVCFPLYFMVSSSFKAENEILATPIHWFPWEFQGLSQYQRAFDTQPVGRWFFNSALMAVLDVTFTVFFSALAGFGFAKYRFRGRQFLFLLVISTMFVPFQMLLVPLFMEMRVLGWTNSYAGLIIPGLLNALGVFMMRQFSYNIPDELLDAARIDGAGEFRIFWRIGFPLLAPASASLAIIIFLFSWNNFLWPLIIVQSPELQTLPVGMTVFTLPYQVEPSWGPAMAVSTLATLPIALLFLFFQRYFIEGMLASGIKG